MKKSLFSKETICLFCIIGSLLIIIGCSKNNEDWIDSESGLYWINSSGNIVDSSIYYVSPEGSDEEDGKSIEMAFYTIAKALSTVKPGGTIRILPGNYNESIGLQSCGSSQAAITVEGYNGTPVLDGKDEKTMAIFCEKCNNYIFQNLDIRNYTDMGIAYSAGFNLVLKDLIISENGHTVQLKGWEIEGYGIHVEDSKNIIISDNQVYRNGPDPQIFPTFLMGTGINTYNNEDVLISNNVSYDNIGGGYLVEDSYNVIFENNEGYGNDLDATEDGWWDACFWLDGGGNVIVRDNYFHDNLGPGIEISDEDFQNPKGYVLKNNRSNNNYYGIFIWNFGTTGWPDSSIIKKSGNDFSGNSVEDIWIEDWY